MKTVGKEKSALPETATIVLIIGMEIVQQVRVRQGR